MSYFRYYPVILLLSFAGPALSSPSFEWRMASVTPDLRAQFPACEKFLAVRWIDEQKGIGYARFDERIDGTTSPRHLASLVYLDRNFPRFDYDIRKWWTAGTMQQLTKQVRNGRIDRSPEGLTLDVSPKHDGTELLTFDRLSDAANDEFGSLSIDRNRSTVCIVSPPSLAQGDAPKSAATRSAPTSSEDVFAWAAELKNVDSTFSETEFFDLIRSLGTLTIGLDPIDQHPNDLKTFGVLKVGPQQNRVFLGTTLVYPLAGQYWAMAQLWKEPTDATFLTWGFPPSRKTCKLEGLYNFYVIFRGSSVYLDDTCNLDEIVGAESGGK